MMRKTLLLAAAIALCTTATAQDFPLQFVDAQGNAIADGTLLTLNQVEVVADEFDEAVYLHSGVFVKNITADDVDCGTEYSVTDMSNGVFQTCFPLNCVQRTQTGKWTSEVGTVKGGELKDMMTEWIPTSAGESNANFQLIEYVYDPVDKQYVVVGHGPKLTMHFVYDPAAIRSTEAATTRVVAVEYYNASGQRVEKPTAGLHVVKTRYAGGHTHISKQIFF